MSFEFRVSSFAWRRRPLRKETRNAERGTRNPPLRAPRFALRAWAWVIPAMAGVLAAVHFQSASAAPVLSTNLPPMSPALPEVGFSVIRVFGALALVLALFLAGVWLFKNWQRIALQRGRPAQLQVVEMKHLGGKHALYVVAYQQQRLLLASSPNGVSLVSHLPPGDSAAMEPPAVTSPNFVQVLQQAVQGKQ